MRCAQSGAERPCATVATHANAPLDFVAGEAFHHGDWCGGVVRERGEEKEASFVRTDAERKKE